ncbi:MAG: DNA polymerase III subunit delta [Bacilli bacterium]|nr:DNA polymerase III subunit delta [Bacilli bacterium]
MNNYLIVYDDIYLLNSKIDEITSKDFKNITKSIYDLDEKDLDDALLDLDTYSFLSDKKIVIIKNIENLNDDKKTTHLINYLDSPNNNNLLILTTTKFNGTKKINKTLKEKTNFIKLESDPITVIKNLLKDYKLEPGVINKISIYSNNNLDIIKTECDKLINYKEDKNITVDDVEKLVVKHLGDSSNIIFDLVKYISSSDKKRALEQYKLLQEYSIDDIGLIGLIESQLRLLEQVSIYKKEGLYKDDIASKLNIHPYRIQKTMELLNSTNITSINNLIKSLSEIDYKVKAGLIDSKDCILMYIINI